jgi:hypothetical protein
LNAGNFTTTGRWNTAIGHQVLTFNGTGVSNTAIGAQALERNTAGGGNAAIGLWALRENTTGSGNTAIGAEALRRNTTGAVNTALGFETMIENTTGSDNVATGHFALLNNRTGNGNTAIGRSALQNTTGHYNTALGREAGVYATGDFNVFIGANSAGVPGESNAMYLGTVGLQTKTLIAGIRGTSIGNAEVVVIDQDGRLGSVAAVPIGSNAVGTSEVVDHSLTADDLAPSSVTELAVAPNSVTPEKVAFSYAASATKGGAAVDVSCMSCISPSEVTFSPGLAVFDSAGVRAGTLVSANMVARQLDGRWYSYQVSAGGFPTPTSLNFFYATTDCSGDAYMGGAPDPLITFITIHGNSGTAFHPNSETITLNSSAMFKSRREYGPNDDPASPAVCSPFNPTITGIFGVAIPFELSRLGLTPPFRIGM